MRRAPSSTGDTAVIQRALHTRPCAAESHLQFFFLVCSDKTQELQKRSKLERVQREEEFYASAPLELPTQTFVILLLKMQVT